jgi:capsular exopolysaccharide synthesis family protein
MSADLNRHEIAPRPPEERGVARTGHAKPRSGPSPVDPWLLLRALGRRWLAALVVGVLLAAIAGPAIFFLTPPGKVTASRTVRMTAVSPSFAFEERGSNFEMFKSTQIGLIRSRENLRAALARPGIGNSALLKRVGEHEPTLDWLERELRVTNGSTEFVQVSLLGTADEAADLQALVSAITDEYLRRHVDAEEGRQRNRRDELKKMADVFAAQAKELRESVEKSDDPAEKEEKHVDPSPVYPYLSLATHAASPAGLVQGLSVTLVPPLMWPMPATRREMMAAKELDHATQQLSITRDDVRQVATQLALLNAGSAGGLKATDAELLAAADRDPAIVQATLGLAEAKRLLDREKRRAPKGSLKNHPVIRPLAEKVAAAEKDLDEQKKKTAQGLRGRVEEYKARNASLGSALLRQKLGYLRTMEQFLAIQVKRLSEEVAFIEEAKTKKGEKLEEAKAKKEARLASVKVKLNEAEAMLAKLHRKAEELDVELKAKMQSRVTDSRVQRADGGEAALAVPNDQARKALFAALGAVVTFLLGCFAVAFFEMRTRRLGTANEITDQLGLQIIGTLPYCKGQSNAVVQRVLKEAVDGTRTLLLRGDGEEPVSVVMIASAAPAEGKTSLACHLAASIGRTGRKTLLIDADMRKPDIHAVFGVDNVRGGGLAGVLRGEASLADAIIHTDVPGLSILPAGQANDQSLQELASGGFLALLQAAEQDYDYILIDTSPLLAVSDALLLAAQVDGVVLATLQGETRLCRLGTAADRLTRAGGRILGVIVNGAKGGDQLAYSQYARYLSQPRKGENP